MRTFYRFWTRIFWKSEVQSFSQVALRLIGGLAFTAYGLACWGLGRSHTL